MSLGNEIRTLIDHALTDLKYNFKGLLNILTRLHTPCNGFVEIFKEGSYLNIFES